MTEEKPTRQLVGMAGLYYVCYELAKRGWNALPTSRNAKGTDIIIYSQNGEEMHTIEVKTLSERNPIYFNPKTTLSNFLIICRRIFDKPKIFIAKIDEKLEGLVVEQEKAGKKSYWIHTSKYEQFKDNWAIIGTGW